MSFIFTMRSTPMEANKHRREPSGATLPAISEDSASSLDPKDAPPIPPRSGDRPGRTTFGLDSPPLRLDFDFEPPAYSHYDVTVEGPGEKLGYKRQSVMSNKYIAERGGWKRAILIGIIVILCLVALIVGLVVGLHRHKGSKNTNSGSSSPDNSSGDTPGTGPSNPTNPASNPTSNPTSNPSSNPTFPAGSYSFPTFLDTISTNCTSNSATWLCYPYSIYSSDPSSSEAIFQWIISPVKDSSNYTISSTSNYFSIEFTNLTLSLQASGQADEHYFFQTFMEKPTKPTSQLGSENVAATCYFNQTTLQAYLYTKMPKTYTPSSSTNTTSTAQSFTDWPYAVKIEQVAGAGTGVPTCLDPSGDVLGDFSVQDETQLCDCLYLNTGT